MYRKILIATDGSELAGKALVQGLDLAVATGAEVVIVTVTDIWSALDISSENAAHTLDAQKTYEAVESETAAAILAAAAVQAEAASVPFETLHLKDQRPSTGILQAAHDVGADLIVLATHGRRGVQRMLLGSQTSEVIVRSDIPVLVLR